jgi:non-ribosomal peptide synthetase-like protein
LSIGSDTILRKDSILLSYKAQANFLHTGPIHIGSNAFVGEASVIDINTTMEDETQLGHSSSLQAGQQVPRGKRYHGSPAQETSANYCVIEPRKCSSLRRWTYALTILTAWFVFLPLLVLSIYAGFPHLREFIAGPHFPYELRVPDLLLLAGRLLVASLSAFAALFAVGLLAIGLVPRSLNLALREDKTYVVYGVHYLIQRMIARLSNSAFFNRVFGDSCGIVHYVRWLGYRLNKIVQTGSNFGEEQYHDNPFLVDIGSGTMISDGLMMVNTTMSNAAFRLNTAKIGDNNYLGNYVRYPAGGRTGVNCLLGTMVLVPIEGPVRENVGLLGSPCFEIPRAVTRDTRMAKIMDESTRRRRMRAKNLYNFVTAILFLLKTWVMFSGIAIGAVVAILCFPMFGMAAVFAFATFALLFAVLWSWFVERASLGFKWLSPQIALVLDKYYWFHERHWHLFGLTDLAGAFSGTPFKNIFSRLEGIRLGKKVFDDGVRWTEYSLIEIGDYTNLNFLSTIWPHSLEEGVFKSDYIKIGAGCTLHSGSLVHYGVTMGDHVVLDPGSYLMKGEILDPYTRWRGNPAKAIASQLSSAEQVKPEALLPAKAA